MSYTSSTVDHDDEITHQIITTKKNAWATIHVDSLNISVSDPDQLDRLAAECAAAAADLRAALAAMAANAA